MITSCDVFNQDDKKNNKYKVDEMVKLSQVLVGYKYFNLALTPETNTEGLTLVTRQSSWGIKFYMREIWQQEIPQQLYLNTCEIS